MFFAGIYTVPKDQSQKSQVSVITTSANEAMSEVHDRMPVILNSHNAAMAWLQENDKDSLSDLMTPASNEILRFTEVSSYVNKSSNGGSECIEPLMA
jgi:putative SOS response-associated peptidase YedK